MKQKASFQLAEDRAFQRGFDRGLSFARQEGLARYTGVKSTMIFDFLASRYELTVGGKRQAAILYQEFSTWWVESGRGPIFPSSTEFGKKLSRVLRKSKINGCIYYNGLTPFKTLVDGCPEIQERGGAEIETIRIE